MYNDERIRALICFACARVRIDTGRGRRSDIELHHGRWLMTLPESSLYKNFSLNTFKRRYAKPMTPLHPRNTQTADGSDPDYTDWTLSLHPNCETILSSHFTGMENVAMI